MVPECGRPCRAALTQASPMNETQNPTGTSDPQPSLHILQIETFGRGGLTHYAYNLSLALAERGHRITFVTADGYELEAREALPEAIEVRQVIGRWGRHLPAWLPAIARGLLRKVEAIYDSLAVALLARRLRPDVIHLHCTNQIALFYLRALERLGRPLVATAHVVTPHEPIAFQQAIYSGIHGAGDLIIAHSDFDRQRLLDEFAVEAERVTVIPHGEYGFFEQGGETVERGAARRSLGLSADDEVVLFFGYIRRYKGLDILFDAWPAVMAERPRARVVVAGDPVQLPADERQELEARATELGAVHHFGYVAFSEVSRYFAAADVLVMPYRHISQSGVLFLALSLGVPVVASRVGALPEMLDDGDSALLVPPESADELAMALRRILGDAALRQRLASGGRRVAQAHGWPTIAERTATAYRALLTD